MIYLIGYRTEGGGEEGRLEGDEDVNLLLIDFSNELDGLYGEGRRCWWKYPHEQVWYATTSDCKIQSMNQPLVHGEQGSSS